MTASTSLRRVASFRSFASEVKVSDLSPKDFQRSIGLDWTVEKEELGFGMLAHTEGLEDLRAIVRQDRFVALGVVGKDYAVVQNDDIFQFFTDLQEFDLGVKFVSGGSIGRGESVWALARVPSLQIVLGGDDVIDTFLMVSNGHSGNATLKVDSFTFRKVCSNGMHAMTKSNKVGCKVGEGWVLKHTQGISDRFSQVQGVVKKLAMDFDTTTNVFQTLSAIPANWDDVKAITESVWGVIPEEKGKSRTIGENRLEEIRGIWQSPTSQGIGTEGTMFTAVNAVTEWIEHESTVRVGRKSNANAITDPNESRFVGNYLGGSASDAKEMAYSFALSMI
jgi:phage/plasmid-like protein (TIGR03299 family)